MAFRLSHLNNAVISITALLFLTIHNLSDLSGSQLAVSLQKLPLVFLMIAGCVMTAFVVIKSVRRQHYKKDPSDSSLQCGCVFKGLRVWPRLLTLSDIITVLLVKETFKPNCPESLKQFSLPL